MPMTRAVLERPTTTNSGQHETAAPSLATRLAQLERRVADLERATRRRPSRGELLTVIANAIRGRAFTSTELLAHADVDAALATLFDAAGIRNPKQLGRALRRLERHPAAGWRLERVGDETPGIVWSLRPGD